MIIKQEKNIKMNMEKKITMKKGIKLSNQIKWEKMKEIKLAKTPY